MTALRTVLDVCASNGDGREPQRLDVRLAWRSDDPFRLEWTFLQAGGDVTWHLSREMLSESLITYNLLGVGDVRVQRYVNACAVRLEFTSPNGYCAAATCTTPLTEFINATYRIVPPGCDVETEAVDHALAELLARAHGQVNE